MNKSLDNDSALTLFVPLLQDFERDLGHSGDVLWIKKASKDSKGTYTCVCTWWYNQRKCKSSASRNLTLLGDSARFSNHL